MPSDIKRKLAAIVFTDIANSAALFSENETKAIELLNKQRELIEPLIVEFDGIKHKEIGDGLLLSFPTVTSALKFSIKLQEQTKAIDDLNVRIGIHEGEISLIESDIFGDDVNIASRIEKFSPEGGIAISGKVQQNISSLPEYETKLIGSPQLKGVKQKVDIYCISSHGLPYSNTKKSSQSSSSSNIKKWITAPLIAIGVILFIVLTMTDRLESESDFGKKKIAVLYFENMTNDLQNNMQCAGMTDAVITALSKLDVFTVKSRTDVLKYKGKVTNHKEIQEDLGVDAFIESSLQIVNNVIRINVKLIDAYLGDHIWNKQYDRPFDDILQIQDDISQDIALSLDIEIGNIPDEILNAKPTDNIEAYKASSQGIYYLDMEMYDEAISAFDKAIAIDPDYSHAHYYKGIALQELNNYEDAIVSFKSALPSSDKFKRVEWNWQNDTTINNVKIEWIKDKNHILGLTSNTENKQLIMFDLESDSIKWTRTFDYDVQKYRSKLTEDYIVLHLTKKEDDITNRKILLIDKITGATKYSKEYIEKNNAPLNFYISYDTLTVNGILNELLLFTILTEGKASIESIDINSFKSKFKTKIDIDYDKTKWLFVDVWLVQGKDEPNILFRISEPVFTGNKTNSYKKLRLFDYSGLIINEYAVGSYWPMITYDHNYIISVVSDEKGVQIHSALDGSLYKTYDLPIIRYWCGKGSETLFIQFEDFTTRMINFKPNWFQREIIWEENFNTKVNITSTEHRTDKKSDKAYFYDDGSTILEVDSYSGKIIQKFNVKNVNSISYYQDNLYIITQDNLIKFNTISGNIIWKSPHYSKNPYIRIFTDNGVIAQYGNIAALFDYNRGNIIFTIDANNPFNISLIQDKLYRDSIFGSLELVSLKENPEARLISEKEVLIKLADSYMAINYLSEAKKYLNHLINLVDPTNSDAFRLLSEIYLKQKDKNNYINSLVKYDESLSPKSDKLEVISRDLKEYGGLLWQTKEDGSISPMWNNNGAYAQFPDGDTFVELEQNGNQYFGRLDIKDGLLKWKYLTPFNSTENIIFEPLVDTINTKVMIVRWYSWVNHDYGFTAIDSQTGKQLWHTKIGTIDAKGSMYWVFAKSWRISIDNHNIYFSNDGQLYCINKISGSIEWSKTSLGDGIFNDINYLYEIFLDSLKVIKKENGEQHDTYLLDKAILYQEQKTYDYVPSLNSFIYTNSDSAWTSFDLNDNKINWIRKRLYNNSYLYHANYLNKSNLFIESAPISNDRDVRKITCYSLNLKTGNDLSVKWTKEINRLKGEDIRYSRFSQPYLMTSSNFNTNIEIHHLETGELINKYTLLWGRGQSWLNVFHVDDSTLYLRDNSKMYAISPNLEW